MQPHAQAALRQLWLKQEQARCRQLSQNRPNDLGVWRRLARACWELGEAEPSLAALDRALALQPDDGECLLGRIVACLALGRAEEALAASVRLLELFPDHTDARLQQIEALRRLGRPAEALQACEQLLALPRLVPTGRLAALSAKMATLDNFNRLEDALAVAEDALALAPTDPVLGLHRATLRVRVRRFVEALTGIETALATPETRFGALCVQAQALAALRRFDEADAILNALQAHYPHRQLEVMFEPWRLPGETLSDSLPKRYTARGLYLIDFFNAQACCDWTNHTAVLAEIEDLAADALRHGFVAGLEPFSLLSLPITPALQASVARAQATAVAARMAPIREMLRIEWPSAPSAGRLRIGYVSGDFRHHATAHLTRKLFRVHDRTRFEIVGFSLHPDDGSFYRRDIVAGCDRFVELSGLSNAEAATRIAQEGIHILVDLHGYTRYARPEIFALRPAPVQISFLGYPGTSGANYISYIIADRVVLPDTLRPWFSEQPVYLPDCYQVNDDEQPIASTGITRLAASLPEDGFVYCCFNIAYKIEPNVFGAWMRILRQTPNSVLWLLMDTPRGVDSLRAAARARGVDPARLVFAPRLSKAEHLERHRLADLFLDTFIVNAHTTASDALWAGLPVVTLRGEAFQSRVCASLLTALGLSELIVDCEANYEALAVELAHASARLGELRARLEEQRLTRPLFDTDGFARNLERAFQAMWSDHEAGGNPKMIDLQQG
ncbi:MAG: glycosyltransferase [Candidatus Contendobacter sp.]|nr:glycosyltransferase [Candidatus Contendobacter sp.]